MDAPVTTLPTPSTAHATCAWCRLHFANIVELLEHVEGGHLAPGPTAA
ncbi:MAG: hypothetical protein ABR511_15335 [Acidimicrobiales bacterium]